VRPLDRALAKCLESALHSFDQDKHPLIGIQDQAYFKAFLEQLLDSVHRVKYYSVLLQKELSENYADPNNEMFDPIKAAIIHHRRGHIDEAFWLVFLSTHFGKHAIGGWRYAREIYGRLGHCTYWDWERIIVNPSGFKEWLHSNQEELKRKEPPGGFGNHRKYESLNAYSSNGTGAVVESYVKWVNPPRTHQDLVTQTFQQTGGDPHEAFDQLYQSMQVVKRFGRTACFDYLTMVSNLDLAAIEPRSAYLKNSTGPITGAQLLFGGENKSPIKVEFLEGLLIELDQSLKVGMQVLEDALCNWQKSPDKIFRFRG
jgi:hypothetical protein